MTTSALECQAMDMEGSWTGGGGGGAKVKL